MIRLEKRPQPSQFWTAFTPVVAVLLTMVAGGILFAFLGKDPFVAIKTIFWDPILGEFAFYYRSQLLVKGAPLILIAIGLSLGFRAGIWNIGAEGQYIIGAVCGAAVGLAFYPMDARWLIFPLMVLAGAFGGLVWAMIPAILKTRFKTNEILVSLLLVYVAEQILASMALGTAAQPRGRGLSRVSRNLRQYESAANNELIAGYGHALGRGRGVHRGDLGLCPAEPAHAGLPDPADRASARARHGSRASGRACWWCSAWVSRARLAGLAGLFEVAGPAGQISIDFNVGYGFTAIIVAFLGRLHPVGILLAGLLMALTYIGGEAAQATLGLPAAAIQAFQGMLLFFLLAVDVLTNFRIRFGTHGGRVMDLSAINPLVLIASADGGLDTDPAGRDWRTGGREIRGAEPRRRGDDDHRRDLRLRHRGGDRLAAAGLRRRRAWRRGAVAALRRPDAVPAVEPGGDGPGADAVRAGPVGAAGAGLYRDQAAAHIAR